MAQIKISLRNSAGELDCRIVDSETDARAAALDLISGTAFLVPGDTLVVTDLE